MVCLIFLTEKKDVKIKNGACINDYTQKYFIPTKGANKSKISHRNNMNYKCDQRQVRSRYHDCWYAKCICSNSNYSKHPREKIIVKIKGSLENFLVKISRETYIYSIIIQNYELILQVYILKRMLYLAAAALFFKKFQKGIEEIGQIINPCDICVVSRIDDKDQTSINLAYA